MARVFLVGCGPLPYTDPDQLGFSQLRTDHALKALLSAGHDVRVALIQPEPFPLRRLAIPGYPRHFELCGTSLEVVDAYERLSELRADWEPDVVVSAGPYLAARAAALSVGEEPFWADVPGDPFGEAQAKDAHEPGAGHAREMRAAYAPALARADAFGAISWSQRCALLGQLGWLGRLSDAPPGREWVFSVPAAFDFGVLPQGAPRMRPPESPLTVALSGGYNTWFDADTLLEGLQLAMAELPELRVVSTGGAIPGHHNATYEAFRAQALSGIYARRFTFHGWVPHSVLPRLLGRAHVGVTLDRPGVEPELGTRTRVLFFAHQGMPTIATARSDLTRELAGVRMMLSVPPGDPPALARALERIWRKGQDGARPERLQGYLASRYSISNVYAPMLQWVADPARVAPARDTVAELSEELARIRTELASIYNSPTWKVSGRANRLLKKGSKRLEHLLSRKERDDSVT
jgi:glycosyltransferase involved in cell wall biosynthesis